MKPNKTFSIILSGIFIALAIVIQYVGKTIPGISQLIIGSIINCILISSCLYTAAYYASIVAVFTPITAFLTAVIPAAQGPFIPFISIANLFLVLIFSLFKSSYKSPFIFIGIIIAAIFKFLFLYISANYLIKFLDLNLPVKIQEALKISMGITQLITSLIGGFLAALLYRMFVNRKVING